jgi:hypothetical protein
MHEDIYVYVVELPPTIREAVTPCAGGYTVYINRRLTHERQMEAYRHALTHIDDKDFLKSDVQAIEAAAHGV